MAGTSRRRILAAVLVAAALLAAVAVWLWRARHDLTERALLDALAARGATPASLRVVEAGPGGLVLEDLRVGEPPDLRVARLEVTLTPGSAAAARLASARAEGVVLRGRLGPDGLQLGAARELLLGGDDEADPAPLALPARHVVLRDARVELATPTGAVTVEGRLEAREGPQGALHLRAEATLRHALGRARVDLEAQGPPDALEATASASLRPADAVPIALAAPLALEVRAAWTPVGLEATGTATPVDFTARVADRTLQGRVPATTLRGTAPGEGAPRAEVEAHDGMLRDPATQLRITLQRLEVGVRPDAVDGVAVVALRDLHEPARVAPLRVAATLAGTPTAPLAELAVEPPGGDPVARVQLRAQRAEGAWRLHGDLLPVDLDAVDLATRAPALAAWLGDELALSGELEGRIEVRSGAADVPVQADLALRDVDVTTELASLYGLHGRLRLVGPPWRTPDIQTLAMERLDAGLVLDDGTARLRLHPGGHLELREAVWRFAGGRIRAGADLGREGADPHGVLTAEEIDVAALTDLLAVEGLEGTGTLAGALPIHLEDGRLEVRDGVLHNVGDGTLRWRPPAREALAGRPGMDLLLTALRDFRYVRVELELDGDLRGAMDVGLHLRGSN
ncbi:MAG: YdbH domain-containing protein, partial [Myxococcota bacterium]|nr:YdbH domain-containing protein [Myxococcota bacterium]